MFDLRASQCGRPVPTAVPAFSQTGVLRKSEQTLDTTYDTTHSALKARRRISDALVEATPACMSSHKAQQSITSNITREIAALIAGGFLVRPHAGEPTHAQQQRYIVVYNNNSRCSLDVQHTVVRLTAAIGEKEKQDLPMKNTTRFHHMGRPIAAPPYCRVPQRLCCSLPSSPLSLHPLSPCLSHGPLAKLHTQQLP